MIGNRRRSKGGVEIKRGREGCAAAREERVCLLGKNFECRRIFPQSGKVKVKGRLDKIVAKQVYVDEKQFNAYMV